MDNVENIVDKIIPVDKVYKRNLLYTSFPRAKVGVNKRVNCGFTPYQQYLLRLLLFFINKNKIIKEEEVDKYGN